MRKPLPTSESFSLAPVRLYRCLTIGLLTNVGRGASPRPAIDSRHRPVSQLSGPKRFSQLPGFLGHADQLDAIESQCLSVGAAWSREADARIQAGFIDVLVHPGFRQQSRSAISWPAHC